MVIFPSRSLVVRKFGLVAFIDSLQAMRDFTQARGQDTPDELWLLQHPPVYTHGVRIVPPPHDARFAHIPVVPTERGGLMTYHGPGQLIVYTLFNLQRAAISIRGLVHSLEQSLIDCLAEYDVHAIRRARAPGVYIGDAKIAALGLRVRRGACYHGLSVNINMDLSPFTAIDPCGYVGLAVTQVAAHCTPPPTVADVAACLSTTLAARLGFTIVYRPASEMYVTTHVESQSLRLSHDC